MGVIFDYVVNLVLWILFLVALYHIWKKAKYHMSRYGKKNMTEVAKDFAKDAIDEFKKISEDLNKSNEQKIAQQKREEAIKKYDLPEELVREKIEPKKIQDEKSDQEIYNILLDAKRITPESSKEEREIEKTKYIDEINEKHIRKQIKELAIKKNETIQIPFDEAMFLLRHYNKKSVITEDGNVMYKNMGSHDEENIYRTVEEANEKILPPEDQELLLPDGEFLSMKRKGNLYYLNEEKSNEILVKENKIA